MKVFSTYYSIYIYIYIYSVYIYIIYIYNYIITYFTFLSSQKNSHLLVMGGFGSKILGTSVLASDCVVSNPIQRPTDCSVPETTPN